MHRAILPVCLLAAIGLAGCPSVPSQPVPVPEPPPETSPPVVETPPAAPPAVAMPEVVHKPMAKLLPAGVLMMIESAGMDNAREALNATDVGQMLAEPAVARYLEGPGRRLWAALLELLGKQQNPAIRQAVSDAVTLLFRRPWALAVTDYTLQKQQFGEFEIPVPKNVGAVLLCRPADREAWGRLMALIRSQFGADETDVRKRTIEGVELTHFCEEWDENGTPSPDEPQVLLGGTKSLAFVLFSVGKDAAETAEFILRAEAGKANEGLSFAECPHCRESSLRVRYDGSAKSFYVASASLMNAIEATLPEPAAGLIDALGVADINSVQMTVRPEGADLVARAFVDAPAEKGLLTLYGPGSLTTGDLKLVPADAKYFQIGKVDFTAVHGYVAGLMNAAMKLAPPGAGEQVPRMINQWLAASEIDLKRDLTDALGDTVVVTDAPAVGVPLLGGLTIVAEVKHPDRVRKVIARCMAALQGALKPKAAAEELPIPLPGAQTQPAEGEAEFTPPARKLFGFTNPEVQQTDHKGTTLYAVNLLLAAPTFACTDKYLVVTLNVQAARQVLDFLAGDGGRSVAEDADRMAVLAPLLEAKAGRPISLAWGENRTAFEDGYNLMLTLAQVGSAVAADNNFPFSSADLPNVEALSRHLRPTVAVGRVVGDGLYVESRGSLPILLPPTLISLASMLPAATVAGMVPRRARAMAMPDEGVGAEEPLAPIPVPAPDVLPEPPELEPVPEPAPEPTATAPADEPDVILIP